MTRTLDLWWNQRPVGRLTQTRRGELGFAHAPACLDDEDAQPLAATLPKRAEPFGLR